MNKLFAALLFFCVVGASVLWWLMKTLPDSGAPTKKPIVESPVVPSKEETASESISSAETEEIPVLKIDSVPPGAKVEINGVYEGVTPLSVKLKEEETEALVVLEGYEPYRRKIPSLSSASGEDQSWKITLREQSTKEKSKVQNKKMIAENSKSNPNLLWLRGHQPLFFIQLKAISENVGQDSIEQTTTEFRQKLSSENIKICHVNLDKKGKWFRILAGPFSTKKEAESQRTKWFGSSKNLDQGFVTGRQDCI